jgi:hypothetical protein
MSSQAAAGKMLAHMVYFTLKDNSPAAINKMLDACRKYLTGHPDTVVFAVGTRTPDLNREVNAKDFDIALQMIFKTRAAQDAYQVAERHQQFIAENKENWDKVRVYDADVE